MRSIAIAVLWLLPALSACAPMPSWLTNTLASDRLGGIDPALIDEAAADPDHIARIQSAAQAPDPGNPRAGQEARNLHYLVIGLEHKLQRPEYLALARRMYEIDPEHHATTLTYIASRRPLEECEAEILRIAFDPLAVGGTPARRHARSVAALSLIQRLVYDAPQLPRDVPSGAPAFTVDSADRVACYQWTLRAGYGQGDQHENIAQAADCLDGPNAPANDHDASDCRTLLWRLTELGGGRF